MDWQWLVPVDRASILVPQPQNCAVREPEDLRSIL